MNRLLLEPIVKNALLEDLGQGDVTSAAIFTAAPSTTAILIAKAPGILAGLPLLREVFLQLNTCIECSFLKDDGIAVTAGQKIAELKGPVIDLLAGERVALNFLQHLSGIATQTAHIVELVKDFPVRVVDTRKTTPGLRYLEKYAVRQGGGYNHRFNLGDAVLIKDNHIAACGSIIAAVARTRGHVPHTMKIEVEVENEAQVREALEAAADIIMLDNMEPDRMAAMVKLINRRALVEASGNVNETNIRAIAATGVDLISLGSLTHSVKALDISMKIF